MQHYNPSMEPFMEVVDLDNGKGYSKNIKRKGMLIRFPRGKTSMLYEVKVIDNVKIVFIKYIHYDTLRELYSLLAFAAQWWSNLKPNMVYYREKDRRNAVGKHLQAKMGFTRCEVKNELLPFSCKVDRGWPCSCKVYEYTIYNVKSTKAKSTKTAKRRRKNLRANKSRDLHIIS